MGIKTKLKVRLYIDELSTEQLINVISIINGIDKKELINADIKIEPIKMLHNSSIKAYNVIIEDKDVCLIYDRYYAATTKGQALKCFEYAKLLDYLLTEEIITLKLYNTNEVSII